MANNVSRRHFLQRSALVVGAMSLGNFLHVGSLNAAEKAPQGGKTLIVYYSRSGNTATVAKYIQDLVGGDLLALETVSPYPEDYRATTEQAKRELQSGYRPPLKNSIPDMTNYARVFVGSPNWWGTIAPPVMTFLAACDMTGKTLLPFITHEGSGLARSGADIKKLCPAGTLVAGLAIRGGKVKSAQPEVAEWLSKLGLAPA